MIFIKGRRFTKSAERGLVEIEDLLAISNLTAAASHISAYSPTTTIDQNYKDYYQLYYKFMVDGELTGTHLSDLKDLSLKCPFIDGPVIFSARSLYNLATKSVSEYNDDECIFISGERIASINKSTLLGVINYYLFPNPATEQLNIIGKTEKELIDIEIRDVTGKLVIKQNTKLTNYRTSLKLDLVNGIYFVTLINEYGESISKKMVIAK